MTGALSAVFTGSVLTVPETDGCAAVCVTVAAMAFGWAVVASSASTCGILTALIFAAFCAAIRRASAAFLASSAFRAASALRTASSAAFRIWTCRFSSSAFFCAAAWSALAV